ncbi:1-acyl-sn-glycerol-3-phosphate acyltransferase [Actinomadura craniellae]|uniref:1-acyl-sn-glycerol-3-phosphate acyltransferase n=1 Tax=Actinomadura craniellae TaxID=2231787 RepID=A0A365H625_9ACTN|nr:lysophospholipid acyltransferase family protein [Actinomadura craniellae]RAY14537.1 1-acyl-sn-glycerol-3-phosphate acyltransferase [Actinomadura craniellae]
MFYTFMSRVVAPILRLLFRSRVEGVENVPSGGPLIVASNHLSFIDSFIIPLALPRKVTYIAKADYFGQPGIKGRFVHWFLTTLGHVPVKRGARRAAMGALEQGLEILAEDDSAFAIYPEGTRSLDGRLYRGRTGIGWLVLASGAKVLPIGLEGTDRIQPIGSSWPRIGPRATVRIGEPMDFSHYRGLPPAKARRAITDEIIETIQKLSGQDYTGTYNDGADAG